MVATAAQNSLDHEPFRELVLGPWRVRVAGAIAKPFEQAAISLRLDEQSDVRFLNFDSPAAVAGSSATGRGSNTVLDLPGTSTRIHVRPLLHGGIFARLTGARFSSLKRPIAELHATAALARLGAPVPEPGFVLGRRKGLFWQAAVGSVHEEGARDGVGYLESNPERTSLERAARAAGTAVRRLHDLGCRHADLQIKNLLIRESRQTAEIIVVDLDRARLGAELTPKRRARELMRLHRSLDKRGLGQALHPRIRAAFFSAYLRGDRRLRHRMLRHQWFEGLRASAHVLFYPKN